MGERRGPGAPSGARGRFGIASAVLALAAVGLLGAPGALTASEDVLRLRGSVRTPGAPDPRPVDVLRIDGVDHLDLNDVARVFHGTKYWRAELEKMVLRIGEHRVRVTVGSPFVFVDNVGHNLLVPVRWQDGRLVVPVRLATEVLDPLVTETVLWDPSRLQLRIDTGAPNILAIDPDIRSNGTMVEVRLATPLGAEIQFPTPNVGIVRVPGGVLADRATGKFRGIGLVDSIVTEQQPGRADLAFHLGPLAGNAELLTRSSPPRLLFAVSQDVPDDIPWPEFERTAPVARRGAGVTVVALDPGHGGSDAGIVSPTGVPEKAITLAIALHVKSLLENAGFRVHLTRDTDRFVDSRERAEIANGVGADVFVSIHGNGWFDSGMRGHSIGLPRGAGSVVGAELPAWGKRSSSTARRAELFAQILVDELEVTAGRSGRGITYADWAMLEGATMPSLLLECGFLTNFEEGARLSDPAYQDVIGVALAVAIEDFRSAVAQGRDGTQ